ISAVTTDRRTEAPSPHPGRGRLFLFHLREASMRRIGLAVVLTLAVASPLTAQRTFRIVPPSGPLAVGASHTLTFTATDAAGRDMGRRRMAVSCGSLDAEASVDGVRGEGEAAGTARVVCIWQGIADMVALTVGTPGPAPDPDPQPDPEPEEPAPTPDPGTREPDLEETFAYTSTAHMLSDPRGIYARSEDINSGRMTLDTSVRYDGQPTMRYDDPARPGRTEYTISRTIDLRPAGSVREVWVEAAVRFDPHFTLDGGVPNYGQALKLLHVGVIGSGVDSRFGLNFENGDGGEINGEGPNDQRDYHSFYIRGSGAARARNLFDGSWHVVRYHIRLNGNGTATHEFWVDGQYQGQKTARTNGARLWAIGLTRKLNQGPPRAQSMWWGRVRVWYADPGWGS